MFTMFITKVYEKYRLRTLSLDGIYFLDSIPLHVSAAFHFSHHQVPPETVCEDGTFHIHIYNLITHTGKWKELKLQRALFLWEKRAEHTGLSSGPLFTS
jgi:hypothetical protein